MIGTALYRYSMHPICDIRYRLQRVYPQQRNPGLPGGGAVGLGIEGVRIGKSEAIENAVVVAAPSATMVLGSN